MRMLAQVPAAAWPYLLIKEAKAAGKVKAAVLAVCPTGVTPEAVAEGIIALGGRALVLPAWDVQPYDRASPSVVVVGQRLAVRDALKQDPAGLVVVATVPALGVREAPVKAEGLSLKVGETVAPDKLQQRLVSLGYRREEVVQEPGDFARRGGVLDVWPAAALAPIRVEWFDDEVESLRSFDPGTQRTEEKLTAMSVGPAVAVQLGLGEIERFRANYRAAFADGTDDEIYRMISDGMGHPAQGQLLPLFYDEPLAAVTAWFDDATRLVLPVDAEALADLWGDTVREAHAARVEHGVVRGVGLRAVAPESLFVWGAALAAELGRFGATVYNPFDPGSGAEASGVRGHSFLLNGNRHAAAQRAAEEIGRRAREGWTVVLTAPTAPGMAQLLRALDGEGAPGAQPVASVGEAIKKGGVRCVVAGLPHGFVDAAEKLLVVGEADVFGDKIGAVGPKKRRRSPEELIAHFSELRTDDYVVHEQHGIGKFAGLMTMDVNGARQDFLKILYAGDDRLFVPVESLDVLSRYKGAEAGAVTLDRLGTGGWEARKDKVREDLLAMADELMATAAARTLSERPPVERVDGLYDEFAAGFPYALTEDQESVMADVEADLAAGHPMDRLVVGDVGFGKTEVALRAAFLVAASGRQVAIICPTTLLARQHADVFTQRFAGFPMRVAGLSRLVSAANAKAVKAGLAEGTVDIVVGTHALLAKDVQFKNLGMIVVDEEQRFGVTHKEKLKQMKGGIDVLTLTATPIPRTLQMAVGGVRGLSLIATPPVDRLAVQTHVLAWDAKTLKEAIVREIQRGGQVYVVAPHIEDLPRLQDDLATLVPNARVAVAHGQLPEGQLETVMTGFYAGESDILLATTIIESGIDVPRANTLIVYRADRFGLAQLYQLRGRVGRSTARAFAYFLLPEGPLTGDAARRLQILQRLEGLGAGFTLASYDMDLRGFGNLLGKQQSGHIRDIGFELYAKMLRDAVAERQRQREQKKAEREAKRTGQPVALPEGPPLERAEVVLRLGMTYLIPEDYVAEVATRLQLYRKLAQQADEAGLKEFKDELRDRFGPIPDEVNCLIGVMSLRNRAAALNVQKVEVGEKGVVLAFKDGRFAQPEKLIGLISRNAGVIMVRPDQSLVWHRRLGEGEARLKGVGIILAELESLV